MKLEQLYKGGSEYKSNSGLIAQLDKGFEQSAVVVWSSLTQANFLLLLLKNL